MLAKCVEIVEGNEKTSRLLESFLLVDGIGQVTALAVIAGVPEIGTISDEAVAKLVGVVPMDRQSGKIDHAKHIYGGRKDVRGALYMSAVAAVRFNTSYATTIPRQNSECPARRPRNGRLFQSCGN